MTKNNTDFFLHVDLKKIEVILNSKDVRFEYDNHIIIREKIETFNKISFIQGRFRRDEYKVVKDIETWYSSSKRIEDLYRNISDFAIVVLDRDKREVRLFSSLSGSSRLFYHLDDSLLIISNNLKYQLCSQREPIFSDYGIYSAFTLNYFQDPYTYLENTFVIPLGYGLRVKESMSKLVKILHPVDEEEVNKDIESACSNLESEMTAYFEKLLSNDREAVVMLSGGVDSLVLMKNMFQKNGKNFKSVTFALEDAVRDELSEARIAAQYYGNNHFELIVKRRDILKYEIKTLVNTDFFQLGSAYGQAVSAWLVSEGFLNIDIIRGEDTRLHTPFIDLPFKIGFYFTKAMARGSAIHHLWRLFSILKLWRFSFGKNYIEYFYNKIKPSDSTQKYILRTMMRVSSDIDRGVNYQKLLEGTSNLNNLESLSQVHREVIRCMYNTQFSSDVHDISRFIGFTQNQVVLPFMSANVVLSCSRIPYSVSSKSIFVNPKKTKSLFFMIDKIILSKILRKNAPSSLVYRRKTTAPNHEIAYDECFERLYRPLIELYGEEFISGFNKGETYTTLQNIYTKTLENKVCRSSFSDLWEINMLSSLLNL